MNITVAKYGYTDSEIIIQSENVNMTNLNTIWYINDKPYQSYVVGTLSNTGGIVKFRTSGTYSLKASVIDNYGKEYIFTSKLQRKKPSEVDSLKITYSPTLQQFFLPPCLPKYHHLRRLNTQ